jgi:UDP-2-acetamido-3-amino-2,3-dideoxy-glucuronate N-acetyltransferase
MAVRIAQNASVSEAAKLAETASVWDFSQIRENAQVGAGSIIGSFVYIDTNVRIGKNCKIQNRALIYDPAIIHDGVFIGPGAIFTNDKNPRSIQVSGELKGSTNWEKVGVEIFEGASIGAGAICVAPVKIGKWALVAAGSVVTKNVKDFALVVGNPARQVGWVGPSGVPLNQISDLVFECPKTLAKFEVVNSELHEIIS